MTTYIEKPTQEQKILNLLKQRGATGAYCFEFTKPESQGGCSVMQYNSRVFGLRRKGHNIINTEPGHFVLIEKGQQGLGI